jgi:pyruvate/2-oxoglutarate dehydrogenase complex dihydrolipoamide acyltransferase (E2) component
MSKSGEFVKIGLLMPNTTILPTSTAAELTDSINLPQTAVLGMHSIVNKPVVVDGQIVIRPIMVSSIVSSYPLRC